MVKGRIKENRDIHTPAWCTVQELYDRQMYNYLGVDETITRRGGSRIPQKGREVLHRGSGRNNDSTTRGQHPSSAITFKQEYSERVSCKNWTARREQS